jgi:DNA-directed RNA polymerase specialized sigma24 family protein
MYSFATLKLFTMKRTLSPAPPPSAALFVKEHYGRLIRYINGFVNDEQKATQIADHAFAALWKSRFIEETEGTCLIFIYFTALEACKIDIRKLLRIPDEQQQ